MVEMAGSSATKASKAPKASSKTPSKPAGILPPSPRDKKTPVCPYVWILTLIMHEQITCTYFW